MREGRFNPSLAVVVWASMMLWVGLDAARAQVRRDVADTPGDAVLRRFDGSTEAAPDDPGARIDLRSYTIGTWSPEVPSDSLYRGNWTNGGDFFRLDLVFAGLVNPPGPDLAGNNLFIFGPNPILGFVEFDVDQNPDTGGELAGTNFRYHGNAARFGGLPQGGRFAGRVALDVCPGSFDGNIATGPYFPERSGEEFHLALLFAQQVPVDLGTNGDFSFDPGEEWIVPGGYLHRAHGFEDFILLCCSNGLPGYQGRADLLYSHDLQSDRTTISLVYPLRHSGAAASLGNAVEPLDCCAGNQSSIEEALEHLTLSATFATQLQRNNVNFPLLAGWELQQATDYLQPAVWDVHMNFAAAFQAPAGGTVLAWSDIAPDVLPGDFDGNGRVDQADLDAFDAFLAQADGSACDANDAFDEVVALPNFGGNFNLYDLNYDGQVDVTDRPVLLVATSLDADHDGDVDLADFAVFQRCFGNNVTIDVNAICTPLDVSGNGNIDLADFEMHPAAADGPLTGTATTPGEPS